jgi:hypothetical protein
MKIIQVIVDPSSGQPSMSRLCFGILVLALLALISFGLGLKIPLKEPGGLLVTALGITAGLYGANSVAGAWNRSQQPQGENKPPPGDSPAGPAG